VSKRRGKLELYADLIEACPEHNITNLCAGARTTPNKSRADVDLLVKRGLIHRALGSISRREDVLYTASQTGTQFLTLIRAAQEMFIDTDD